MALLPQIKRLKQISHVPHGGSHMYAILCTKASIAYIMNLKCRDMEILKEFDSEWNGFYNLNLVYKKHRDAIRSVVKCMDLNYGDDLYNTKPNTYSL